MKKIITILSILLLIFLYSIPVLAAEDVFQFQVEFTNADEGAVFEYILLDENGTQISTGTIVLGGIVECRGNERIVFNNLPPGTEYKVTELKNTEYGLVYASDAAGVIQSGSVQNAQFVNQFIPEIIFTLELNKVDTYGEPVYGAEFELYQEQDDGYVKIADLAAEEGTNRFLCEGLGAGIYMLKESRVPDGFYLIDPVYFSVTGRGQELNVTVMDETSLGSSGFVFDADTGILSVDIVNGTGLRMPNTGGIGRYVVYGVAGLAGLLAIAIVVVAVKRKKK